MPVATAPKLVYTDSHTRACRRVGSQMVADLLASYVEGIARWKDPTPPQGFTKLGSGISRTAVLGPDGFVYKVEMGDGSGALNARETKYWAMLLRHREWRQYVPHHRTFEVAGSVITAMEHLVIDRDRSLKNRRPLEVAGDHIGCGDVHGGNIGWRGDVPLLLDAAGVWAKEIKRTSGCGDCNPLHKEWKGDSA